MWPFDRSARDALLLPGETGLAWAIFDPLWYAATYASSIAALDDRTDRALLGFYLDVGQGMGHSPNRYFDEAWHRQAYPNIASAVSDGAFSSAFDAYCRTGNQDRAPHWLFDEVQYRRRYPDLTDDVLVAAGLANGYDHFLLHGNREGRVGHPMFDPLYYLARLDPDERAAATDIGPFQHYLHSLEHPSGDRETSRHFVCAWYTHRYPAAARAIAGGEFRSALEHYMRNDTPIDFDPGPDFSEEWYLSRDAGLRSVVESGAYRNGYAHFLLHGAAELRSPAPHIDLVWYAAGEGVRDSLSRGEATDAFDHWLKIGKSAGQASAEPTDGQMTEDEARALRRRGAAALMPICARAPLPFACSGDPAVSVVMVIGNDIVASLATLSSLRGSTRQDIELILIVLGDAEIAKLVTGAIIQRLDADIGVEAAIDAGIAYTRSNISLVLRDGTEIASGAIDAALRRLDSDAAIGAVGGKILGADGLLRSAGHIVWRDGETHPYLSAGSPLAPEANFARDVHFCGSGFLAMRTDLLRTLIDAGARPPIDDKAAADLCLRAIVGGHRVAFDPAILVTAWWDGGPSPRIDTGIHADILATCQQADGQALIAARYADTGQRHILMIEDTAALPGLGSGFVRSNDLIHAMAALGFSITVFPLNGCDFDLASVFAAMPDTVEVMHDRNISHLGAFLHTRRDLYDTIWVARTHNLDRIRFVLDRVFASEPRPPSIILDTEAIVAVRDAASAALTGRDFDLDAALRKEFANAAICHATIAVATAEATTLRALGCPEVHTIGHVRRLRPSARPFAQRAGLLFVGAIHHMDSPNYDGLCWFADEVLPLVEASLRWETRLTVAGYTAPGVSLSRFAHHPRITLRGSVADLAPLYASHRLFVAPTRFAAGAPYKVHEAASHGLPVVATELLRAQLDWSNGLELLSSDSRDPAAFAAQIVALYTDETLWHRLRDASLDRLGRDNNPDQYLSALSAVLGDARKEPGRR